MHDTSSLCQAILANEDASYETKQKLLEPILNLKAVYIAVQNSIILSEKLREKATSDLKMLKELSPEYFKQSVIYFLK
jgi:hypothetical protein